MGYPCGYNCDELPEHIRAICFKSQKGGILNLGVLECDADIADFESLAELQAAETAGLLKWIRDIKATFSAPAPIMIDNPLPCGPAQVLDGFTMTLTFTDNQISAENDTFYSKLNGRNTKLIWHECSTGKLRVVQETVNWVVPPASVPEKNTEIQIYAGTVNWISDKDSFPIMFDAPPGLFI